MKKENDDVFADISRDSLWRVQANDFRNRI